MRRRTRKFIGTSAMLAFVGAYALVAMVVAQSNPVYHLPEWGQSIFFGVVGLAWVLPLLPLIRWMERPDPDDPTPGIL